ncbi:MAG: DUF502 domain-containing protein [Candidatus Deferrimicrobiaceae bacterium]
MGKIMSFLKTTALGGILVLLPLLLFYLMFVEILELVVALATPIADLFPKKMMENVNFPVLVALVLIFGVSFLLGLAIRLEAGRSLGGWIERNTLQRLPLYNTLKSLTASMMGMEQSGLFRPALLVSPNGDREIAYLVEEHKDGLATIMLPWAPMPMAGTVKIVRRDRLEILDAGFGDVTQVLSQWGVGVRDIVGERKSGTGKE